MASDETVSQAWKKETWSMLILRLWEKDKYGLFDCPHSQSTQYQRDSTLSASMLRKSPQKSFVTHN